GLRPHVDGATTFVDSLSTLLVFHVSGRLLHHAMGPNYAALQREMELRSQVMARMPRPRGESGDRPPLADLLSGVFSGPRPLAAGVGAAEGRGPRPFRLPHIFMMENFDGNNGGSGGDSKPPSHRPRVTPPERLTPRRPSPTPIEQALKLATEAPEGQAKIHVTENPPAAERPVEVEEIAFDLAPEVPPGEALAAPKPPALGEIRETMMSPVAPPPPAAIPARNGEAAPTKTIVRIPVLIPGTRVGPEGRFEIRELLSQGANGMVYRVIDTRGGRSAAIKVPKHGNQADDLERFQREIWISENLASGWAVPIYDHFEIIKGSGIQVPLMEFVDGVTLGRVLHRIGFRDPEALADYPLERRVDLFADLCLGVHDAHQHGVIHNDLKPDNLMVDRNIRMRILDWGLARHLGEKIAEGRTSLSPEALRHRPPRASASSMAGTPGYIAPEMTRLDRGSNERSQDIFSLGVILYEMATGLHPLGLFRPGDVTRGEPRLIPIRHDEHPQGQTKINPRSVLLYGQDPSLDPPSFRDILIGTHPDYLYELESIARKAMDPDPMQRFQNAAELREAVLMARARSDREALNHLRERMREAEALTKASWMRFNVASRIDPAHWTRMHQMIWSLRQDRESWHQGVEDLVTRLSEVMKYDRSSAARRMIAELSWERLVDGGDRMPRSVRRALARRIQANDFPLKPDGGPMFSSLLNGTTPLALRLSRLSDGEPLNPELEGRARLRVLRIRRETDARGVELGTFREGETVAEGTLMDWNQSLGLGAGYYVLELSAPGYAPMRVPLRVSYQDVQRGVIEGRFLDVPIEMVPEAEFGPDMALVQGGRSFTGFDFYEDGMPSNVYSFPMHEIELPTFAISRKPVTVGEYIPFIEHLVAEGRIEEARGFMPRKNVPPQRISRDLFRDTWRVYREEGLRAAFEHFINRQRGNHYYWRLRPEGFGPWKRYRLMEPTEHLDPNGDPILKDQPISAISRLAAEAFLRWESERQGREYSLPTAEEKEKVDRNAFPWNFPWGYDFAPFYLISRLAFSGELKNSTYPQPVGKHVMDQSLYRDFSIYGTVDNLGNVREYTASHGEPGYVVLSGGSVRVPYGPFYYPASRNYAHRETAVDDSVGAFRRVQRFGRPQPRDLSPEAPPVR
ncbi:MAG: SUMF1/EgtB/PvdO family nonheme iron enzyme, partial [Deltaproteobacteria bacterium]|nr:SUMF1/EgtB/PvdO family nonheme iron enzyme [Deltaproteobacteria bacterium]